ncbi:EF-hand domain-containing protein 1 isoform X2 [Thalassophryne amazonica]|nr:EF-hand domain-containing protein 1 isoform X2 [Thalassophryne amazonica]
MPRRPSIGIGNTPLLSEQLNQQNTSNSTFNESEFTYGHISRSISPVFIPAYVALGQKVLRFDAYFKEEVLYFSNAEYRIRPVNIYYYLEDDSMSIYEPVVQNSGLSQGLRLKRQRLPTNNRGAYYHWKDLNLGVDLEVFGVKYRITHCDAFTKEFLESEGMVLNDPEPVPLDQYTTHRKMNQAPRKTHTALDQKHRFLTLDDKVLRFFALLEDKDSLHEDSRPVTIHYFLVDDTVEIREDHTPNSGLDPFPVLMRRQRVLKKVKPNFENFPACVLEVSSKEVDEYYSPADFKLGEMITLMARRYLLQDCDGFTKQYFQTHHLDMEQKPIEKPKDVPPPKQMEVPPYNGFGSLEDSFQNCVSLIPQPPKKNMIKFLENNHKVLRYSARLDSQIPEDEGRIFVLSYFLADDMISIFEKPKRNSGIIAGKFLEKSRVPKPNSTLENPEFYSPADFAIGATVEVFRHRFVLTDADLYVLKHLESISSQIPTHTLDSVRQKVCDGTTNDQPVGPSGGNNEAIAPS